MKFLIKIKLDILAKYGHNVGFIFLKFDVSEYNNLIIDRIIDDETLNKDLKNNLKEYIISSIRDIFSYNEMYLVYNSDEDFNKTFKEDSKTSKPIKLSLGNGINLSIK